MMSHTGSSRGMRWRVLAVGFLVAGLGAVGARPAQAATSYVCEFTGTTTSLTPIAKPPALGGTGSFTFSGSAKCVRGAAVLSAGIFSTGTYSNTVCGTGSASGTASLSTGPSPFNYTVLFAGGQGALRVTGGGSGAGAASIAPTNTGGCVTQPATGFTIRGAIKLSQ